MIEGDASCIDVLRQTYAVRKAIEKLEAGLIENHVSNCIHRSIAGGNEEVLLAEFTQIYQMIENR